VAGFLSATFSNLPYSKMADKKETPTERHWREQRVIHAKKRQERKDAYEKAERDRKNSPGDISVKILIFLVIFTFLRLAFT